MRAKNEWEDYNSEDCPLEQMKPCPFCEGNATLLSNAHEEIVQDKNGAYIDSVFTEADTFWCACPKCEFDYTIADSPEAAIKKWNHRRIMGIADTDVIDELRIMRDFDKETERTVGKDIYSRILHDVAIRATKRFFSAEGLADEEIAEIVNEVNCETGWNG